MPRLLFFLIDGLIIFAIVLLAVSIYQAGVEKGKGKGVKKDGKRKKDSS